MQKFLETVKQIGNIPEGATVDIEYPYINDGKIISALSPDCGACTSMFHIESQNKIIVRFHADNISQQVLDEGEDKQEIDRGCKVVYADGGSDRLEFKGFIVKANG